MNELLYNFLNQIEDQNRLKEITVEDFEKIVKANNAISAEQADELIESFKKISRLKIDTFSGAEDEDDERRKKYIKEKAVNINESKKEKPVKQKENNQKEREQR